MNILAPPDSGAAFVALAILDRYQGDLDRLVGRPRAEDWERIAADIRDLRRLFAQLPALCVPWLSVLMSGLDLLSMVAQQRDGERLRHKVRLHATHVAQLERCCRGACAHAR